MSRSSPDAWLTCSPFTKQNIDPPSSSLVRQQTVCRTDWDDSQVSSPSTRPFDVAGANLSPVSLGIKLDPTVYIEWDRLIVQLRQFVVAFFTCSSQLGRVNIWLTHNVPYNWSIEYAEYRAFELPP